MDKTKLAQWVTLALVLSMSVGCSDSSSKSAKNSDSGTHVEGGGSGGAGEAVSALGTAAEALNTLPVFAQLDESTGLLTDLGGTVDILGAVLTQTGGMLTITFIQEDGIVSGLTTKLTAIVRPLVVNLDGTTQVVGEALVVGPVASNLLEQVGTAVVVLGNDIRGDDNAVLASLAGTVEGSGQLVVDAGGLLSVSVSVSGGSDGDALFDLAGLLGGGDDSLVGAAGGLLDDSDSLVGTVDRHR